MTESEQFCEQLASLGLHNGDTVLVHASMKALETKRRPEEILDELQNFLGKDGTLLLPALTYDSVTAKQPVFDSRNSEPCIGLLPRTFLHMPDVVRSVHPTHSVCARGRLSHALTAPHLMDDTAVGPHSPFMLLPLYAGKLLFIGKILHACTFMHGIEEIVRPPYLRAVPVEYQVDGVKRIYQVMEHYGWGSEFQRIEYILEAPDLIQGKLGNADACLIDSRALLAATLVHMRADPHAFVTDISRWI